MIHHAWAKLDEEGKALPLTDHAADVASVLRRLLVEPAWIERLGHCAGRPLASRDLDRLATLAFLQDLGKANAGFWEQQFPGKPRVGHTGETAPLFFAPVISEQPVSSRLQGLVEAWGAADLFCASMAHHGRPLEVYAGDEGNPDLGRMARDRLRVNRNSADHWLPRDGYDPQGQLGQLLDAAEARFSDAFSEGQKLPTAAAFVSLFCGLLTLADWLGSDTSLFPVARPDEPERDSARDAVVTATVVGRGLATLGTPPCDFAGAFGLSALRGIQAMADDPGLGPVALIEAETGSGKTEAALWRWLALRRAGAVDGLYFALPTRSAAVQLHGRVQNMLDRVFGFGALAAVLAVPGYIRAGDAEGQALPEFEVTWEDDRVADGRWAAERPKRFLAARVAVGTIDQVLMAGLQLRHAHLRAAALSRNLLVVDEVHASDAFMGEVLGQVLRNHVALGGHALLLSATLTAEARSRLLSRPQVLTLAEACEVDYPALSGTTCEPVAAGRMDGAGKLVALEAWPSIDAAAAIAARGLPRTRGDGPGGLQLGQPLQAAPPAPAGMDPTACRSMPRDPRLPRTRGDGPNWTDIDAPGFGAPPHPRGWTRSWAEHWLGPGGSPAPAGMDPMRQADPRATAGLPRTRGDGPRELTQCSGAVAAPPHPREWTRVTLAQLIEMAGSPAPAGMDPGRCSTAPPPSRLPRTRGDGPLYCEGYALAGKAPPHPRGWTPLERRRRADPRGSPAPAGMDP